MKLYLLNILQSNDVEDIYKLEPLLKKYKCNIYQSDLEGQIKYLAQLMFEKEADRDAFADEIPQIAFEFGSIDYPDELYQRAKTGEFNQKFNARPNKFKKPNQYEIKVDSWLEKHKDQVEHVKLYSESIYYDLRFKNGKKGNIIIAYKGIFIIGGIESGNMVVCRQKSFMLAATNRLLDELEKEVK